MQIQKGAASQAHEQVLRLQYQCSAEVTFHFLQFNAGDLRGGVGKGWEADSVLSERLVICLYSHNSALKSSHQTAGTEGVSLWQYKAVAKLLVFPGRG